MTRFLLFFCFTTHLVAQTPGSLDLTFGSGGIFTTAIGSANDQGTDVAQLSDGNIIVVGHTYTDASALEDFFVMRLSSNGAIDPVFGVNGKTIIDFLNGDDQAQAVEIQPDGKILVAGYSLGNAGFNSVVARLLPNGTLDAGFGTNGRVVVNFGSTDFCLAMRLLSDGKILLAGRAYNGITSDFALARLLPNGTLDNTFGTSGKQMLDLFGEQESINAIAVQPDGKIVAVGETTNVTSSFAVARLLANGSLDPSFGNGGKVKTTFGTESDVAYDVALQPDGKMMVVGQSNSNTISDLAAARYLANGELDLSFSDDGKLLENISMFGDYAFAVALQADGKILLAGSSAGQQEDLALFRYLANGTPDLGFGDNGRVLVDAGAAKQDRAVAMQVKDGKILIAGQTGGFGANDLLLARFEQGPLMSPTNHLTDPVAVNLYPNPARAYTTLSFQLQDAGALLLHLYNVHGQLVQSWKTGALPSGMHQITLHFDGPLPAGLYCLQGLGKGGVFLMVEP